MGSSPGLEQMTSELIVMAALYVAVLQQALCQTFELCFQVIGSAVLASQSVSPG